MYYIKHFNEKSGEYQCFRPGYPEQLFDYLATLVNAEARVWDCGTGNGQAALVLAKKFQCVFATDIHLKQLDVASQHHNVHYICCPAEKTPFLEHTMDLITIAQALHWFNFDNFYDEVKRIAKPSSTIAAWCYSLGTVNANLDPLIRKLYADVLGDEYWPKERRFIDEQYRTIPFPFKKMKAPSFTIEKKMNFHLLIGYLNTWSAVKEYQNRTHTNPIELIYDELLARWGNPTLEFLMHWPVHLLIGQID